ncbi:MAG: hypothetical protein KKB50_05255 [Planctomycetes bacterium]|nr:hypothetical protein [Planctomycetota bacterium]
MSASSGRRALNATLLVGGACLLVIMRRQGGSGNAARAFLVAALIALGLLFNLAGALRRHVNLRSWLRGLTLLMIATILLADLSLWFVVEAHVLPSVPRDDVGLKRHLLRACADYMRIAIALAYLAMSTIALPGPSANRAAARPAVTD